MTPDPSAPFWTLDEVAAAFGLSRRTLMRDRLAAFEAQGFPMPLPWCRRQRRYHPGAVLAWKRRHEIRCRAALPDLKVVA